MSELTKADACTIELARLGERVRLRLSGRFELPNVSAVEQAIAGAESRLRPSDLVDIELTEIKGIDGAGASLLARMADRVDGGRGRVQLLTEGAPDAGRLVQLYRDRAEEGVSARVRRLGPLARLGGAAARAPAAIGRAFDYLGGFAAAVPKVVASPRSVNWRSVPVLLQQVGADALPVTAAANLLVGLIIGFLGVAQLGRFGAVSFVPELVIVAHFRELGPLVTAVIIAGRSGAGLASELGTMKVSEEIDALKIMGFDPMRWLVLPRCLVLLLAVPLLTWIGDLMAVIGGLIATVAITDMSIYTYLAATERALTLSSFLTGMVKTPVLGLAIGLIATQQGLATRGGAAAVGARTTTAVVLSMIGVILLSSLFTIAYAALGV
jgi:phospholipid/cholesterol/gamma-HCH transport system permease protein